MEGGIRISVALGDIIPCHSVMSQLCASGVPCHCIGYLGSRDSSSAAITYVVVHMKDSIASHILCTNVRKRRSRVYHTKKVC